MGREAVTWAQWPGGEGEVKALLESRELILRGSLRRRWALPVLDGVRVEEDALAFTALGEAVRLRLGAAEAAKWAALIAREPPSLRAKLGLGERLACVAGPLDDPALAEAVAGWTADAAAANMLIVIAGSEAALTEALAANAALAGRAPVRVVHGKGRGAAFGDAAARGVMRAAGFMDNKVAAVSETLSATRYARRKG